MDGCLLFVAVHLGPYLSMQPLEQEFGPEKSCFLLAGAALDARQKSGGTYLEPCGVADTAEILEEFMRGQCIEATICGTSDGLPQGNVEERVFQAATRAKIPVFVIEDFPGNYRAYPGTNVSGIFVEDEGMLDVYFSRGITPSKIFCTGNPRYDALRMIDRRALRVKTRTRLGIGEEVVVLWAGQPDEASSSLALERVFPCLSNLGVTLLFRAHPRELSYRNGRYDQLLSSMGSVRDVTNDTETAGLCCAADLVMTQFSSVGVEASYLGTPALFLLFDDLGKAYLKQHKGYEMVPWANRGGVFVVDSSSAVHAMIETALYDESARTVVRENFRRFYGSRANSTREIATVLRQYLSGNA